MLPEGPPAFPLSHAPPSSQNRLQKAALIPWLLRTPPPQLPSDNKTQIFRLSPKAMQPPAGQQSPPLLLPYSSPALATWPSRFLQPPSPHGLCTCTSHRRACFSLKPLALVTADHPPDCGSDPSSPCPCSTLCEPLLCSPHHTVCVCVCVCARLVMIHPTLSNTVATGQMCY